MHIVEKFISINGEGRYAGELAVFIRFPGCNLRCSYCDTMWANEKDCETLEVTIEELLTFVIDSGTKHVTITGGEPLLQPTVFQLCKALYEQHLLIEIETNGSVDLSPFLEDIPFVSFTMDYKMPSSHMEEHMHLPNLALLRPSDTLKLVSGSTKDLEKALELIPLVDKDLPIYLSPIFGEIEPCEMVDFIVTHQLSRLKLQLQLHKFIWPPEARGV